jgi:3-oxoadipate enol-lactonase
MQELTVMAATSLFIDGDDVRFHVRVEGPEGGKPLMFSNSLGSTLAMWDAQAAHFAQFRRVIRYDARGHGDTSCPPGPYTLALLARDALRILDSLHLHVTDWVGCSMGGMVGQWLLTHHAERIDRAVLGNTAAFMGPPATDWNARIRMAQHQGMAPIAEAMRLRWFTKPFNQTNPAEVARVCGQVLRANPMGYSACAAAIRDMDQRQSIRAITNQVLVVVGAEDPATLPEAGHLIAERIAGAKLITLPAAHIANCEVPELYNKAVGDFLGA